MPDTENSVAVVTVPDISEYNSERVNYGICSCLKPEFDITLVGAEQVSERIASSFETEPVVRRGYENKWIRRVLLIPLTFYAVLSYVRTEDPDVVASFGNLAVNGLACALVSKFTNSPSVVRVTSDFTNLWKYQSGYGAAARCFVKNNILGRIAIHVANSVIVLGPVMEWKLEKLGVASDKIWVIPQPLHVDTDESTVSDDIRSDLDIPSGSPIVLFVGYFKKSKGPERLVDTVKYVLNRDQGHNFVIVGSSGEFESAVRQALSSHERVHFTGWVPHDDLATYFESADVLLHPSNTDGLPNVVLEALYYDLPVVATDSGGEVAVHVSNIGNTYRELGEMILSNEIVDDPRPDTVLDPENRTRYQLLLSSLCQD